MGTDATAIAAGATLTFAIKNVKVPPSMASISGFTLTTTSENSYGIDVNSATITYAATTAASIPSSYIVVSAATSTVNSYTTLTLRI